MPNRNTTKETEILERYEEWNPDEETVGELVEELSISRQRLYQVLDKHNVVPKTRRKDMVAGVDSNLMAEMAEMALGYLLTQLQEARTELTEYRNRYGPL